MKNKTTLYVAIGVLLLVVVGGVLFVKSKKSSTPTPQEEEQSFDYPTVASSVEVDLEGSANGRSVTLSISNVPDGTTRIQCELNYTTSEGLPKGAVCDIKESEIAGKSTVTREILLGTCSTGGKCVYDEGVTSVNLVVLFHEPSGITQFKQEFPLE